MRDGQLLEKQSVDKMYVQNVSGKHAVLMFTLVAISLVPSCKGDMTSYAL